MVTYKAKAVNGRMSFGVGFRETRRGFTAWCERVPKSSAISASVSRCGEITVATPVCRTLQRQGIFVPVRV
ncbi:MAG: hypothetical protein IJF48_03525 [Clostridia bacterium]|nr:hypothetical protein [Clostridia bacterium]